MVGMIPLVSTLGWGPAAGHGLYGPFILSIGSGRPSAGWAKVDRREGTFLTGKLLTPKFAPTALSSEENNYLMTKYELALQL